MGSEVPLSRTFNLWTSNFKGPGREVPGPDEDHSRGPRAVPHPRAGPGHPGDPSADSAVLPGFSATAATDRGRARSFDCPHPGAGGCDSPARDTYRAPRAATGRRAATRDRGPGQPRSHPPRPAIPANNGKLRRASQPGQPTARRPAAELIPGCDPRSAGGPGWPPAPRESLTVRPAPPRASASSPSPHPQVVRDGGTRIRLRPCCGRSKERARPWSVAAVAEKPGRTVRSAHGSPGGPGACPRVRHCRGSRLWSSSSPGTFARTLGITRPGP